MTPEEQQQISTSNLLEAISAQRNAALNGEATRFAQMMVEKTMREKAEARVKELEEKYEPKPKKLEAVE